MASDMRWWRLAFKRSCRITQTATLSSPASKTFSIVITFVHRDLKPENIMLSGYWKACLAKIKLICFSICTCKKNNVLKVVLPSVRFWISALSVSILCINFSLSFDIFSIPINKLKFDVNLTYCLFQSSLPQDLEFLL